MAVSLTIRLPNLTFLLFWLRLQPWDLVLQLTTSKSKTNNLHVRLDNFLTEKAQQALKNKESIFIETDIVNTDPALEEQETWNIDD
jgi:hypothetical protein